MSRMGRISAAEQQYRLLKRLRERLKSRDSSRTIFSTRSLALRLEDARRRTGDWIPPAGDPPGWADDEMGPSDSSVAERLRAAKKRFSLWCAAGMGPVALP